MADNDIDTSRESMREELDYEPPMVFDFGSVFQVTRGSGDGNADSNGQEYR
jgi:hypothetical protein